MLSSRDRGVRHTEGSKMKIKDGDFKELVDALLPRKRANLTISTNKKR